MSKQFVWIPSFSGPSPQIWYEKQTDGNGKAKATLMSIDLADGDKRELHQLMKDYPYVVS